MLTLVLLILENIKHKQLIDNLAQQLLTAHTSGKFNQNLCYFFFAFAQNNTFNHLLQSRLLKKHAYFYSADVQIVFVVG